MTDIDQVFAVDLTNAPRKVIRGTVATTVTSPSDDLYVIVHSFDGGRVQWGPCPWVPSSALPVRGEDCLVLFDEQEVPWVMVTAPVDSSGYLDGGVPGSVYGGTTPIDGGGI